MRWTCSRSQKKNKNKMLSVQTLEQMKKDDTCTVICSKCEKTTKDWNYESDFIRNGLHHNIRFYCSQCSSARLIEIFKQDNN